MPTPLTRREQIRQNALTYLQDRLKSVPDADGLSKPGVFQYKLKPGDTLWELAYALRDAELIPSFKNPWETINALTKSNKIKDPSKVRSGKALEYGPIYQKKAQPGDGPLTNLPQGVRNQFLKDKIGQKEAENKQLEALKTELANEKDPKKKEDIAKKIEALLQPQPGTSKTQAKDAELVNQLNQQIAATTDPEQKRTLSEGLIGPLNRQAENKSFFKSQGADLFLQLANTRYGDLDKQDSPVSVETTQKVAKEILDGKLPANLSSTQQEDLKRFASLIWDKPKQAAKNDFSIVYNYDGNKDDLSVTDITRTNENQPGPSRYNSDVTQSNLKNRLVKDLKENKVLAADFRVYDNNSEVAKKEFQSVLEAIKKKELTPEQIDLAFDIFANVGFTDANKQSTGIKEFLESSSADPALKQKLKEKIATSWGVDPQTGVSQYETDENYGTEAKLISAFFKPTTK